MYMCILIFICRLCRKLMKSGPKRVFCESQPTADEPARYTIPTGILLLNMMKGSYLFYILYIC